MPVIVVRILTAYSSLSGNAIVATASRGSSSVSDADVQPVGKFDTRAY